MDCHSFKWISPLNHPICTSPLPTISELSPHRPPPLPLVFPTNTPWHLKQVSHRLVRRIRSLIRIFLLEHLEVSLQRLAQLQNGRQISRSVAVIRSGPHLPRHSTPPRLPCTPPCRRSTGIRPWPFDALGTPAPAR